MDSIFDLDHLYRTYFKMALPSVFGLMVSVVYNLADTFFIAQSNDTALIAGVSLCAPVFTALMAFGNIYGQGGSSLISRLLGQDDREGTGRVSSFCFYVALTTGVVLAALMMLFRVPLLGILGATAETMPHAEAYYTVLAIGAPATVLNFIHSNLVRCEGMATQSMIGSIGGTVINIILDPILITTVGWGARGAAIATIVGYLCSDLYFLWLLHKKSRCLSVKLSQCHVTGRELQQILGVGVTAALSNLMQSLTVIVMNQFLLPYGNDKIAAMGIASKVSMIAQLVLVGFSFGGIPLFGYLYGAKKRDVMRKLIRFCLTFLVSIAVVLSLILCLNSGALMRLFVQDAGMIATGAQMLRWQVYTAAFGGVVLLLTVLFQATGKIIPSFLLSISRQGVVFLLALVVCVHLFQYQGVLMAQAVADILSAALALGLLAASGQIPVEALQGRVFAGELSLSGALRPVPGMLPLTIMARQLGLANDTGVEITAAQGRLTWSTDTNYQDGLTLMAAIGQGNTAVTPLQLAQYAATLANYGRKPTLHFADRAVQPATGAAVWQYEPAFTEIPGGEAVFGPIRDGMKRMAQTARALREAPVTVAAKTGSPQLADTLPDGSHYVNSVLIGYAPADDPQIAMAVVLEYGGGGANAAPVMRAVLDAWFE